MPNPSAPVLPADVTHPTGLLHTLLTTSLAAIAVLRPLYEAETGVIRDFAWVHLNPAGQRMLRQPECPVASLLTLFPTAQADGVFAKCCQAFRTGEEQRNQTHHQADGLDGYFLLVAQRYEDLLVVNFLDTHAWPRTAAEDALRESQAAEQTARRAAETERQRLHAALMQMPASANLLSGPDHVFSLVNPGYAQLFPGRVLLGRSFRDALPELAGQGFFELLNRVYQTGEPAYLPEAEAWADFSGTGQLEQRYYNTSFQPVRNAAGQVTEIFNFAADVTAQVRTRQQIEQLNQELEVRVTARAAETKAALFEAERQRAQAQQQQARLGQMLGQMPAAIATLSGPTHRFSYFNAAYHAISADRAVLGQTVAEVFPELVEQGVMGLLDHVYTSGEPFFGSEILLMIQDPATGQPEPRYLDFTYQPLLDAQQQTEGLLVFALDVTERVRTRKQADILQAAMRAVTQRQDQERENAYQLFEQAPAAVCLLREPDHRVVYLNPAYQALFPGQELRGQTLAQVHSANAALVTLFDGVYRGRDTQFQREVPVLVPQGPGQPSLQRYFDFTYQAYREEGRIVGVSLFGFDVTEQVLARQQVQYLNEELAAINEELHATNEELHDSNTRLLHTNADLDTFVYTASHDLKVPMANIEGLLDVLSEYLPPADQEPLIPQVMTRMRGAIARFQQTVGHLTDVSHLQHHTGPPPEAVDVARIIEDVRLDLLPLLEGTQARLLLDIADCPPVRFAPKDLRSIAYNLLSNAVKYRAPDRPPVVHIRTRCAPHQLVLEVQDNGLGLDAPQQGKLFQMFKRLHYHVEGSGVGLYMIKRLITNAGGTISVQSEPGVGSTFTVVLPLAPPSPLS